MRATFEHFGFENKSDNIVDAYIMSRIARELFLEQDSAIAHKRLSYQDEAIKSIVEPPKKKAKAK